MKKDDDWKNKEIIREIKLEQNNHISKEENEFYIDKKTNIVSVPG